MVWKFDTVLKFTQIFLGSSGGSKCLQLHFETLISCQFFTSGNTLNVSDLPEKNQFDSMDTGILINLNWPKNMAFSGGTRRNKVK